MKEETKKKLETIKKIAVDVIAVGSLAACAYLLNKVVTQEKTINNLKGELKNVKDVNRGLNRAVERQAFTIGKLHNQLYGE